MTVVTNPAIIVGSGSANGLGVTRDLGRRGIPVYCVASTPHEAACYSKYCRGYAVIPGVETNPKILLRTLTRLATRFRGRGVLFPTTDTTLLTVSAIREQIRDYVTFISPKDVVETMVIKSRFYQSLKAHGIPHPATYNPAEESLEEIIAQVTFPVFVRPVQTLEFFQHFHAKGFMAMNSRELRTAISRAQRQKMAMLVQEIVKGSVTDGYGFKGYFNQKAQPILMSAVQKLRQPSLFSNSTVHKTIPRAHLAQFEATILTYLKAIGFTGLFGLEFKRDAADGQFKVFDVNARSCGDSALGSACGLNDLYTAYRDALGETVNPPNHYQPEVYYIAELEDVKSMWNLVRHGQFTRHEFHPYLQSKQLHMASHDDPRPFLHEITHLIQQYTRSVITKR